MSINNPINNNKHLMMVNYKIMIKNIKEMILVINKKKKIKKEILKILKMTKIINLLMK